MALSAMAFNDQAPRQESAAAALWFQPVPEQPQQIPAQPALASIFLPSAPFNLSSVFLGAGGAAMAAALTPASAPATGPAPVAANRLTDSFASATLGIAAPPSALDAFVDKLSGGTRKMEEAAGMTGLVGKGALATAFQSAVVMTQQQGPAISPAQQAFLNQMNASPDFAQNFANRVNAITTALDQPKSVNLKTYETVNPNVDIGKIDVDNQRNFCQADDAKNGLEDLKNIMEAHAEEVKAAEGPADPMQPPAAIQPPVPGEFTMSPHANPSSPDNEAVEVAAHGRGTGGVQGASAFADGQPAGYTGANAAAPAQAAAAPAADGRMFLHGPGLTNDKGESRVAITADGKLEIDGMGMDQLEHNIDTIHRESKMAAENMDTIADRGVTTGLAEAADLVRSNTLDATDVKVNANGTAQVFQLNRGGRGGPGMGA